MLVGFETLKKGCNPKLLVVLSVFLFIKVDIKFKLI